MALNNDSIILTIVPWFIPCDVFMIFCTAVAVGLAVIFLIFIIFDKTCHTIPMMLVANSCAAELIFASDMLGMAIFTLNNDIRQIQYQDTLCIFRGYLGYVVTVLQNYSYLLQAIYRYITVVYPTHLSWQSVRSQLVLISLTWIFGLLFASPFVLTSQIKYNPDNQICQMPLQLSFLTIYNALGVYMIPISFTILIYFKLVRYVQEISKTVTTANTLSRAQRELKMVRRIVILITGVATIGFPYAIFIFISFFTSPHQYHFRIAYIFNDASLVSVMIALFKFTDPLRMAIMKKINRRTNMVLPTIAYQNKLRA